MPCFHPLDAYKSINKVNANGKSIITFNANCNPKEYEPIRLPCGQCMGCRIARSRAWAVRCMNEASMFGDNNCFVTLTYDDKNMPDDKGLNYRHFQNFMKYLRKDYSGQLKVEKEKGNMYPIRFFMCGEYGDIGNRPHYHACLFNFDFSDRKLWAVKNGVKLYRSAQLEQLWKKGFSVVGDVTYQSAAYIARYIMKKVNGKRSILHYVSDINTETGEVTRIRPEFVQMSRAPGIGRFFYEKYKKDLFPKDSITVDGKMHPLPDYYSKIFDVDCSDVFQLVKDKRLERIERRSYDYTDKMLRSKEICLESRVKRLKRKMVTV